MPKPKFHKRKGTFGEIIEGLGKLREKESLFSGTWQGGVLLGNLHRFRRSQEVLRKRSPGLVKIAKKSF